MARLRNLVTTALTALLFVAQPARSPAEYQPPSLGNTTPESFRGADPRRQILRKSDDPWFGLNPQSRCPITGRRLLGPHARDHYVDYQGFRIYLSSPRLKWLFHKFPRRSLRQMYDWGERPERAGICPTCGETLGSTACCRISTDTTFCLHCGRHAGSPGCCQTPGAHLEVPPPRVRR